MKKYILLFTITLVTLIILLTASAEINAAVAVKLYNIHLSDGENTVTVSGRLQYLNEQSVRSENYTLVGKVHSSDGDYVKKGDAIMTVYELLDTKELTNTFPEAKDYLKLISKTELSEEIADEIKKYTVEKIIRSPSDGILTSLSYNENSFAAKGNVLFKISDKKTKCLIVNVSEAYIEGIKTGQKASIIFSAVNGKKYSGSVYKISDEAKQTGLLTGKETSVEVLIKIDNPDKRLKIGYTAECVIKTSVDKNIIIIPYEYIHSDEKGDYVYLKNKNRAVKTYIKTGSEYKKGIRIINGLKCGDQIILPDDDISDGQRITEVNGE